MSDSSTAAPSSCSRRDFLRRVQTSAVVAAGTVAVPGLLGSRAVAEMPSLDADRRRANQALQTRGSAAAYEYFQPHPSHPNNGDEQLYPSKIGSFSKGLPHSQLGEVDPAAFAALVSALSSGDPAAFERIPLGGTTKLVNPQGGLAFVQEGPDPAALASAPAPTFHSAEEAGEIIENYWMALARDVPFTDYGAEPITQAALADLNRLSDFRGPRSGGRVTPSTLFRGLMPGDVTGPYLSQLLCRTASFGSEALSRQMQTTIAGEDFMTGYGEWLTVQRGLSSGRTMTFDQTPRLIRNGRDLARWVHMDVLYQAYFEGMLVLFTLNAPFDASNPYNSSVTQTGFATFGQPYVASLVGAIAREALKAVWYEKWSVHRRLRPEAFGGRIHNHLIGAAHYPIHPDALNSAALTAVSSQFGSYLLPMAFAEGCPLHPAYAQGHGTVAGACTTLLKTLFDESWVLPDPVITSPDGLSLLPYTGPALTVGGELNKLASNVAFGRNHAGVHWRSDAIAALTLGEEVALRFLREERATFHESFTGFRLTKFDGTETVI